MDFEELFRILILLLFFAGPVLTRIFKKSRTAPPPEIRRQRPAPEPRDPRRGLPLDPLSPPEPAGTPPGRDLLRRLEEEFFGGGTSRTEAASAPAAATPPPPPVQETREEFDAQHHRQSRFAAKLEAMREMGDVTDTSAANRFGGMEAPALGLANPGQPDPSSGPRNKPSRAKKLLSAHGKAGLRHAIILKTILDPPPGLTRDGSPDIPGLKS